MNNTGPTPHPCAICGSVDMVPDIMPYSTGGTIKQPVHEWIHPMCYLAVRTAAAAKEKDGRNKP